MNRVVTVIMVGTDGDALHPLTDGEPVERLRFAGAFRVIDFALMNCARPGLSRVVAPVGPGNAALARHLRNARGTLGVRVPILSPTAPARPMDVLEASLRFLDRSVDDVLVILGKNVHRLDYAGVLARHRASGASATVVSLPRSGREAMDTAPGGVLDGCGGDRRGCRKNVSRSALLEAGTHSGIWVDADSGGRVSRVYRVSPDALPPERRGDGATTKCSRSGFVADGLVFARGALVELVGAVDGRAVGDFFDLIVETTKLFDVEAGLSGPDSEEFAKSWYRQIGAIHRYWAAHVAYLRQWQANHGHSEDWKLPRGVVYVGEGHGGRVTNAIVPATLADVGGRIRNAVVSPGVRLGRRIWIEDSIVHDGAEVDEGCAVRNGILACGARVTGRARVDPRRSRPGSQVVTSGGITVVPRGVLVRGPAKIPRPGGNLPRTIDEARSAAGG